MHQFHKNNTPDIVPIDKERPMDLCAYGENRHWCEGTGCKSVSDLNDFTCRGDLRKLIRINEALHEKQFSQIADLIHHLGSKLVMLAGPSASGKTTTANRLATQLCVLGMKPIIISLDDYYIDRDQICPGPDGKLDLENINAIDTRLFRQHIYDLTNGESTELPTFNFLTGKREWKGNLLKIDASSIVIVEGIHGLNPILLPKEMDSDLVFKLYVSPLLTIKLDGDNQMSPSLLRLMRRIVRDYKTRGASVQQTLSMWDSVRRGERQWIIPFKGQTDVIFNSSALYELAVLKRHINPLLSAIEPKDRCNHTVRSLVTIMDAVLAADVDDEIPPTSLIREFIGGNSFYR